MNKLLLSALLMTPLCSFAQGVGIGTTSPNAAAALDITASNKGLLIPRLDSATRVAIATPPAGLLVYQTAPRAGFYYYTGAAWVFIPDKARAGDNLGNHTATQALNLQGNALTGTGASISGVGLGVRADGGLNLGQNTQGNSLYLGFRAGAANTGSSNNVYLGYYSGASSTGGSGNTFLGNSSGQALTSGNDNVFAGYRSGAVTTTGASNTFVGTRSGERNVDGGSNVFMGSSAGNQNTSGSNNIFLGSSAGQANATGSNNVAFGANSGPAVDGLTNTVALGAGVRPTVSNTVILGNNANVGIGTTTPAAPLDVNGSIWSRNTVRVDANDTNTGALSNNAALYFGTAGSETGIGSKRTSGGNQYGLDFYTGGTQRLTIGNGGTVSVGVAGTNTGTAPDLVFGGSGTGEGIGSARSSGNPNQYGLDFYTGFSKRLSLDNNGNVGVGTPTPSSTLQVVGSVSARIRTLTSGTVADNDYTVLVGGNISLPAPSASPGRLYNLLTTGGSYVVTAAFRDTGGTFGTYGLNNSAGARSIVVQSDGTNWWIISSR